MTAPHLRPNELAARWHISWKTLARWRWTGEGPRFLKVSGKVLYRLEDIEAFEAAHVRSRTDERATPMAVEPFAPKRGKRRNHVTLAWPSVAGDRRRGLAR
jgi:hypothetical protein